MCTQVVFVPQERGNYCQFGFQPQSPTKQSPSPPSNSLWGHCNLQLNILTSPPKSMHWGMLTLRKTITINIPISFIDIFHGAFGLSQKLLLFCLPSEPHHKLNVSIYPLRFFSFKHNFKSKLNIETCMFH